MAPDIRTFDRFQLVETPLRDGFAGAVTEGLSRRPRSLPPRYFYDEAGTELYGLITQLPEYYLTRTEIDILERAAGEIDLPPSLIEFGGGHPVKARLILEALFRRRRTGTYVSVDISRRALTDGAPALLRDFPGLTVRALVAEFEGAFDFIPPPPALVLFLGSNIGNFEALEAKHFLSALRGYALLVGFDLRKDARLIEAAYNDAQGVTARFNLNLLERINRELGGAFVPSLWEHLAFYDEARSRIEMHLVSRRAQAVRVEAVGRTFEFEAGEHIHTENSYKFSLEQIHALAVESGFRVERLWTDAKDSFAVALLT